MDWSTGLSEAHGTISENTGSVAGKNIFVAEYEKTSPFPIEVFPMLTTPVSMAMVATMSFTYLRKA